MSSLGSVASSAGVPGGAPAPLAEAGAAEDETVVEGDEAFALGEVLVAAAPAYFATGKDELETGGGGVVAPFARMAGVEDEGKVIEGKLEGRCDGTFEGLLRGLHVLCLLCTTAVSAMASTLRIVQRAVSCIEEALDRREEHRYTTAQSQSSRSLYVFVHSIPCRIRSSPEGMLVDDLIECPSISWTSSCDGSENEAHLRAL